MIEGLLETAEALARGDVTSVALVERTLARIRERDPDVGAWVGVDAAGALRQARRADRLRASGRRVPAFLGIPTGIKDQELVRGHFTRMGSRAFRWLYAPVDGYVARACRRAGFVIVGKCATSELTILPIISHPPTRSPIARERYAGGSSGGSAAAVAAGTIAAAPGSDGGGSIRIPAAFCGLVGVKPGRGVLPNPYAALDRSELSAIGPLARDVRDAAALLDVLGGTDPFAGPRSFLRACDRPAPRRRLRVRLIVSSPLVRVEPAIAAATVEIARRIEAMGHVLAPGPPILGTIDEFIPIMARMVARVPLPGFLDGYLQPSTRWLRERGRAIADAEAAASAAMLAARIADWWGDTDVLVTPTVGVLPPRVGDLEKIHDESAAEGLRGVLIDGEAVFRTLAPLGAFTAPFNVSGQPALSIPAAGGGPIGVQLVGRPRAERMLLALARRLIE